MTTADKYVDLWNGTADMISKDKNGGTFSDEVWTGSGVCIKFILGKIRHILIKAPFLQRVSGMLRYPSLSYCYYSSLPNDKYNKDKNHSTPISEDNVSGSFRHTENWSLRVARNYRIRLNLGNNSYGTQTWQARY